MIPPSAYPDEPAAVLARLRQLAASEQTLVQLPQARKPSYLVVDPDLCEQILLQERDFSKSNMRFWRQAAPSLAPTGMRILGLAAGGSAVAKQPPCKEAIAAGYTQLAGPRLTALQHHPVREMQRLLNNLLAPLLFGATLDYDPDALLHATHVLEQVHGAAQLHSFFGCALPDTPDSDQQLDARLVLHHAFTRSYPDAASEDELDAVLALYRAAIASPAASCAWLCMTLAAQPAAQLTLREQLNAAGNNSAGQHALRCFLLETLRLYPPAWLLVRIAQTSTTLGKQHIVPGDQILISPYLQQRQARRWQRAAQFDPDRWLAPGLGPQALLTFGHGPRKCPAMQFSLQLLILMAEQLVRRFHISAPPTATPGFELLINYSPSPPSGLVLTPL